MGIHINLSKNLIYPFLMGVSNICLVYSQYFLEKTYIIDGKTVRFEKHQFVLVWMMFLAEFSIIIFYFIQRKLSNTSSGVPSFTTCLSNKITLSAYFLTKSKSCDTSKIDISYFVFNSFTN